MKIAMDEALQGVSEGEPPFGAIIVDSEGNVVVKDHDRVNQLHDMTSHAECNVVKRACKKLGKADLSGYTLITTCEPCPMCFTCSWLARISRIVQGCTMTDVIEETEGKQRELNVTSQEMNEKNGSKIEIIKDVLRSENVRLFADHKDNIYENS